MKDLGSKIATVQQKLSDMEGLIKQRNQEEQKPPTQELAFKELTKIQNQHLQFSFIVSLGFEELQSAALPVMKKAF